MCGAACPEVRACLVGCLNGVCVFQDPGCLCRSAMQHVGALPTPVLGVHLWEAVTVSCLNCLSNCRALRRLHCAVPGWSQPPDDSPHQVGLGGTLARPYQAGRGQPGVSGCWFGLGGLLCARDGCVRCRHLAGWIMQRLPACCRCRCLSTPPACMLRLIECFGCVHPTCLPAGSACSTCATTCALPSSATACRYLQTAPDGLAGMNVEFATSPLGQPALSDAAAPPARPPTLTLPQVCPPLPIRSTQHQLRPAPCSSPQWWLGAR